MSGLDVDAAYQELENILIVAGHYTGKACKFMTVRLAFINLVYSAGGHGDYAYLIQRLVPLLKDYQLTFYMSGHDHAQYHIEWEGVHYLVSGAGGAELQQQINPNVVSGALDGLRFIAFEFGFMAVTASVDSLTVQMVDLSGSTMYSYTFNDPRDTSFSGQMSSYLLPGIATVVLICLFAFCCLFRFHSAKNKAEAPIVSWRDSLFERTGVVLNNTRGVFEILSDSDDDENHLVEPLDKGEEEEEVVEYHFL